MYQPPPEGPLPGQGNENPFLTRGPQGSYPSYPPQGSQGPQVPNGNYPSYPGQGPQYTPGSMPGAYGVPAQQYRTQPAPFTEPPRVPKKGFSLGLLGIVVVLIFGILIGFVSGFGIGRSGSSNQRVAASETTAGVPVATAGNQPVATPNTQPTDAAVPIVQPTPTEIPVIQPVATQASTSAQWTTTQSFSGNKISKTTTFTVGADWNIQWSCNPASAPPFNSYNFAVLPYNPDGTLARADGTNEICQAGNTSGNVEQQGGGTIYLEISCANAWKVNVQEKK